MVVCLSRETLDDLAARQYCRPPDQVLLTLSAAHDGDIIVVDPWRSSAAAVARRRTRKAASRFDLPDGRQILRLRPHRLLRRQDPTSTRSVRRSYLAQGRFIEEHLPAGDATLIAFNPFAAAWSRPRQVRRTAYFARDDWAASPRLRSWSAAYHEAYRVIDQECDAVFAVSAELAGRVSPRAVVIPNGVSEAMWTPMRSQPRSFGSLERPVALYTGTVDDRIDVPSIAQVLASGAVGSLALAGPVADAAALRALTDVGAHYLGTLDQESLAAVTQHADVGLVPHVRTPLTEAMSPLKMYEYLAAGLPVVATDLPPIRDVHPRIVTVPDGGSWSSAVLDALAKPALDEPARLRLVDQLSWHRRLEPVRAFASSRTRA